ncbi:MAG: Cytochrome c oxidase assembly protein cox15 [Heterodermia speciosa]|uniref:Cytochrome c oxidase assembly protein cox15 n=1 Tax=Heterodermia speciosa TaxID=116794 RepID=A0A8H3IBE3_9LECA|nr:MAG: Cytochrome c oxidase assembly protein cox15 [Heterodermia speciosa]
MPPILNSWPALARATPKLYRQLFTCRQCQTLGLKLKVNPTKNAISAFRYHTSPSGLDAIEPKRVLISKLPSLRRIVKSRIHGARFPAVSRKIVAYWLLGSAASVFGIVVFGGLTRLTESGLSITEWKPVTGSLPPRDAAEWESEFSKYRASPEFKQLNPHMTMEEFKKIYYMEWTHRIWGRVVGLSFLLPAAYFIVRRRVSARMAVTIVGIAGLIGFQGILGWWMVKSGLKDDLFAPGSHPRVSQYRLTAHLGTAFLCYTAMLWNGLSILQTRKLMSNPQAAWPLILKLQEPKLRTFRWSVAVLTVLVFCTAMSGGLVAGLDAGLIYNEFPKMGIDWTPPKSELFSDFYSRTLDKSDIWWRNILENPSLVQLDHRILASTTFVSVMGLQKRSARRSGLRVFASNPGNQHAAISGANAPGISTPSGQSGITIVRHCTWK